MSILKNTILVIALGVVLSGCATSKVKSNNDDQLSSNILYAPAIDVPYSEVSANIEQSIGTDVRWGGRVIESEVIGESTVRLTVFAYPLSNEGRPIRTSGANEDGGRFIVDLTEGFVQEVDFQDHLVTFYGDVSSGLTISNGNRSKTIPVINAQELVDWNMVDEGRRYARDRRGNSYYSLGYRGGHFGYPYYGGGSFRSGFGHSSFGFFSRGHRFGGSSFGRGRGFSRGRGFGRSRFH